MIIGAPQVGICRYLRGCVANKAGVTKFRAITMRLRNDARRRNSQKWIKKQVFSHCLLSDLFALRLCALKMLKIIT